MRVTQDRKTLALDLRSYGEDVLAERVLSIDDEALARIGERSGSCLLSGGSGLIAKAVTLAAIEVLEGAARQPNWKRRKLKGIWPEQPPPKPKSRTEPHLTHSQAQNAIAAGLKEVGYTRVPKVPREVGIFLKPFTEDVSGYVSSSLLRADGLLEVEARVGVRHNRIDDLIDQLSPPEWPHLSPTAQIILGHLLPEKSPIPVWRFDRETPPAEVATGLANHIVRYGEPWMRERITHEGIIEQLRFDERGPRPRVFARLPVALLLAGRPHEARAALDAELNKIDGMTGATAESFRRFAERFRADVLTSATPD